MEKIDNAVENNPSSDIIEEPISNIEESSSIKEYFVKEETPKEIKEISQVFGESEQELSKEFGYFKANKLFLKMDYLIDDLSLSYEDFKGKCLLADRYNFSSITVYPTLIGKAYATLKYKKVKLRGLIDYPYGENYSNLKILQVKRAIKEGASEIGYVLSLSKIKNGEFSNIIKELKKAVKVCRKRSFYPIINNYNLTIVEIEKCISEISKNVSVSGIVIASYGHKNSITPENVSDFISKTDNKCSIEVSKNNLTLSDTVSLLVQGASKISSASSPQIADELKERINLSI